MGFVLTKISKRKVVKRISKSSPKLLVHVIVSIIKKFNGIIFYASSCVGSMN